MNNKKAIILLILSITLVIGFSFASWIITLTQANTNVIGSKCFNLTLSETNPINLTGAYPLTDTEGASLTPFDFTITNTCSSYASYQVNIEILNTTTLASTEVKVMLDNGTPALLSTKTTTTATLQNASNAYILKMGYLDPNESVTYHLRLWIKEDSTTEASANKTFSSKITISAGYKDTVTDMERCEAQYGEGAAVCNIIAEADVTNSKCLQTDEDGKILNPNSTMSDSDTPIICSMEDDHGTSYYLRGLHTNNNVKFANSCWKIVRVTGTGGIKLIYNGDLDANGKCTTTSGDHNGFTGQTLSLSGNKLYGTSYTKEGSTYTLTDTSTMNWSIDKDNIIGKYTCGNTSSTCSNLYVVTGRFTANQAYVVKLDQSTNYAQIGTSAFNYYSTGDLSSSLSYAGYMYDDVYGYFTRQMTKSGKTMVSDSSASTSNYYYGDTISYSDGMYYITNQDNSPLVQLDWASNYQNNLVGKYTCKSIRLYNNKTIRCNTAYKVLDTTTKTDYMIAEYLTGGRLAIGDIKLSTSYSESNGIFELTSPVTTLSAMDWYNGYSSYNNYYICGDWNQTTCSDLKKIKSSTQTAIQTTIEVSEDFYYGSSFSYDETNPTTPYTLTNTAHFWNITDSTNLTSLSTHHYTCFNAVDNMCDVLYYVYSYYSFGSGPYLYYIKLKGNETVNDALDKMLSSHGNNSIDSNVKVAVDWWYRENILGTVNESKLEDTVFCDDRTIYSIAGWNESGSIESFLTFNAFYNNYYLKCPNRKDAFTVDDRVNGNGALSYPIGFLTSAEYVLAGNANARKTGSAYWAFSPSYYSHYDVSGNGIGTSGTLNTQTMTTSLGVRPSISLKPGTKFVAAGDGTSSNPYVVDMSS